MMELRLRTEAALRLAETAGSIVVFDREYKKIRKPREASDLKAFGKAFHDNIKKGTFQSFKVAAAYLEHIHEFLDTARYDELWSIANEDWFIDIETVCDEIRSSGLVTEMLLDMADTRPDEDKFYGDDEYPLKDLGDDHDATLYKDYRIVLRSAKELMSVCKVAGRVY